jgi:predicted membrane protein
MNDSSVRDSSAGGGDSPFHPSFHPSIGAVVLIAVGVILFLDNLGLVPFANIRAYWPLALSAWGVALLSRSRSACSMVWPWTMVATGVILTLGNLHVIRANWGNIWPLFLIAAGVSMLLNRNRCSWQQRRARSMFGPGERFRRRFLGNIMHVNAVFSSVDRRIDAANFEGADLNSTFAELKVDLRGATIATANRQAILETNAVFGAIKVRVPETWRVVVHGAAVFGAYEDKTVPPRPGPGIDPPVLIIRGNAAFGAVEIEN